MRPSIEHVKQKLGDRGHIVGAEVGVWKGDHAAEMAAGLPIEHLYLIDPWANYPEYSQFNLRKHGKVKWQKWLQNDWEGIYASVVERFKDNPAVSVHRTTSQSFIAGFTGGLDFAYLDGNHEKSSLMADLRTWWPRINPYGILCGHDHWFKQPEVIEAVTEFAAEIGQAVRVEEKDFWFDKKPSTAEAHSIRCDEKLDESYERYYSQSSRWRGLRERINYIVDHVEHGPVLDIGCATGLAALMLANWGKYVVGLDCSGKAIERAEQLRAAEPPDVQSRMKFVVGLAEELPFDAEIFATVILSETLEHVKDAEKTLAEADRVLKDGGRAIISVPLGGRLSRYHLRTFESQDALKAITPKNWTWKELKVIDRWIVGFCQKRSKT